jgi:hypothetical protein
MVMGVELCVMGMPMQLIAHDLLGDLPSLVGHVDLLRDSFVVSPALRRSLFTVRAARSSASALETPRSW